jgi:hypothetical protein
VDPTQPGDGLQARQPGDGRFEATRLQETLRALAREDAALHPSPAVEERLRARVQALRQSSGQDRAAAGATWHTWAGAVAAGLLFVLIWRVVPSQPPGRIALREAPAPALAAEFLPLPYFHVPVATGHIVRMVVPRTALATFGLDPGRANDTSTVLADVFVGEDGIARSVRFVDSALREDAIQEDAIQEDTAQ